MYMFGSKAIVGLDMGSRYLKAVRLKETRTGYELDLFEMLQVPPDLIVEGSVIDAPRLTASLKELINKARIKNSNAVIALSGHSSVIIKRISLPEMPEEELSESIKFEAEQYVPFDIEDVNLDFQILGPKGEPGQMDVVLVAVKKDIISEYVNVVKEAGLHPVIMDINAFALENMYDINYEVEPDVNIALLNIGASIINMNIIRGGVSIFTRDTPIGSSLLTDALQKEFSLNYEEAERLKRGEALEKVTAEDALPVMINASEDIVSELARSLEYFRTTSLQPDIKEVVLSGGCALIKGFPELLTEKLGITVSAAEPFRNIQISKKLDAEHIKSIAPIAAIAVGLAMRRPGDR